MEISVQLVLVCIATLFGACFIQRISGFGLGITVAAVLPYFLGSHTESAALSGMLGSISSLYLMIKLRKDVQWKSTIPCMIGAGIVTTIVTPIADGLAFGFLEKVFGVVLILLSIYFIFFNNKLKVKATISSGLIMGGFSGVLTACFGAGGPLQVIYILAATSSTAAYLATVQALFAINSVYTTGVRVFNGIITTRTMILFGFGLIGVFLGNFAGNLVYGKIPEAKIRLSIYAVLMAAGIVMLV